MLPVELDRYSTPTKYTSVKKAMNLTWEVATPVDHSFDMLASFC